MIQVFDDRYKRKHGSAAKALEWESRNLGSVAGSDTDSPI